MTKVTVKENTDGFDNSVKKIHVGQYYLMEESGDVYLLAHISAKHVVLVNVDNGNRYTDLQIVQDAYNISQEEWRSISYNNKGLFVLLSSVSVTYTK